MKKYTPYIAFTVIALLATGFFLVTGENDEETSQNNTDNQNEPSIVVEEPQEEAEIVMNDEDTLSNEENSAQEIEESDSNIDQDITLEENTSPGTYADFATSKLEADKVNVIFFATGWCPTCQTLDKNISQNISTLPGNINILKADFDNSNDLRNRYDVRFQHTLVQVDGDGNEIKKWTGGSDIEDILSQII